MVAAEWDGNDGHAVGERFLGDTHASVADDAGGVVAYEGVRDEALDANVGPSSEGGGVDVGGGDDRADGLTGERLAGDLGQPAACYLAEACGSRYP